jgi:hypothetical protein
MVTNDIRLPSNILEYFNPNVSSMNPENAGHTFFVYGLLPVTLTKITAIFVGYDTYDGITLVGRFLAAFADLLTVIIIFKIVRLLEKKYSLHASIKYFAMFLYSTSVLTIQLSHFYTVDTFLNFFLLGSLYFLIKFSIERKLYTVILSGCFFGLALSCKISGVYFLPFLLIFMLPFVKGKEKYNIFKILITVILFAFFSYVLLRIGNPYMFSSGNILNPLLHDSFLDSIKQLQTLSNKDVWFPPSVQWITKTPVIYSLQSILFFGLGVVHSILFCFGTIFFIKKYYKSRLILVMVWMILFFLYQSTQFSQNLRYFLFLYPFFAITTSIGIQPILQRFSNKLFVPVIFCLLLWPAAFMSIYINTHSRVTASKWIYNNIPPNSVIITEHWDDSLPLPLNDYSNQYTIMEMPSFDPDTQEKWERIDELHSQADYLILTSNRGWGSIPTVPERYPRMTEFYTELFNNNLQFKKVAEFTSYPSFNYLGIPLDFPNDLGPEDFTVYDHPKVLIFKKIAN